MLEELPLLEGSIVAAVAVIFIKYLLDFLKPLLEKHRNGGQTEEQKATTKLLATITGIAKDINEICTESRATRRLTEDLHKWHDEGRDHDGRFLWYVPTSLESTMGKLADAVVDLSKVLAVMNKSVDEQRKETRDMLDMARRAHAERAK